MRPYDTPKKVYVAWTCLVLVLGGAAVTGLVLAPGPTLVILAFFAVAASIVTLIDHYDGW